jgi:hypothetical protein
MPDDDFLSLFFSFCLTLKLEISSTTNSTTARSGAGINGDYFMQSELLY